MGLNAESEPLRPEAYIRSGVVEAGYKSQPWYEAYMAALFESDRVQIRESIRRAELLILNRERERFTGVVEAKEQRALTAALHALRALHGCLKL